MENKSVNNKKRTKRTIILLVAFFLICVTGLGGIYVWKNAANSSDVKKADEHFANETVTTPIVFDEDDMPEDGSDITEIKRAKDLDGFKKLLSEDGRFAIELTEDLRIVEGLVVRGTKKLVGNKSITMELYADAHQSVFSVPTGSNLILDGLTVDGNGIANGITVGENAGFTAISGKILYGVPYGVLVEGKARIKGAEIDHSMDIGVCVKEGGKASIEGGRITNSVQTAVHIQITAEVKISNDVTIEGAHYLVRNRGTCLITGGKLCDASGFLVYSTGDIEINYQGKDANDRLEWYGADGEAGIRIGAGAKASISGLYIHDVKGRAIRSVNDTGLTISNCLIENTGSYGIDAVNGKKPTYIENVEIRNTSSSAIRAHGTPSVNLKSITVDGTEGFGIKNENTLVIAEGITLENCKKDGLWGDKGSTTEANGVSITNSGRFGVSNNSAKMTLKNIVIKESGRMGYVGKVDSVADLTDLTITNVKERAIYNLGGQITAKNVTIENAGICGVSTAKSKNKEGSVKITNLTVNGVKEKDGINTYESVLIVTDAKITNVNRYGAIASKGGKLTLTKAELKNCAKRGVISSGGTVKLADVVVTNPGEFGVTTAKAGDFVGEVEAQNLTITGVKTKNALNNNASVMKVTNGKISNVGGNGVYVEKAGQTTLTQVEITNCTKRGIYLTNADSKAVLRNVKVSDVINSGVFQEAGTIIEADSVSVQNSDSYGVFAKGSNFTGKNITVTNTKDNGVDISVSEKGDKAVVNITALTVKDTQKRAVANSGGDVTLSDVVIENVGTLGATTRQDQGLVGKMVINGLKMTSVKNGNALNCNGSVLQVTDGAISDVTGNGAYVENGGQIALAKVSISNVTSRGIYLKESVANAALDNVTFEKTAQTAVYQEPGTTLAGNALNIKESGGYGVFTKGAQFDVADVVVHDTTLNPFNIDEGSTAVIRGAKSTITKNDATPKNVAIKVIASTLDIYDGTYNGFSNENGSVIYNSNSELTIHGGTYKDNVATGRGAVIYATGSKAKATIKGGIFENNTASSIYGGGAIGCAGNTELVVEGGLFKNNRATAVSTDDTTAYGGGAIESNGKVTISGGTFQANTAERGGAIYLDKAGNLTITGGVFGAEASAKDEESAKALGNVASYRAGVLYIADARTSTEPIKIENAYFGYNKASNKKAVSSGVLYVGSNAKVDVANSTFVGNMVEYTGNAKDNVSYGGVMYLNGSEVALKDTTIDSSKAMRGGAIYMAGADAKVTITGGAYKNNIATIHGGVIFNDKGLVTINSGLFQGNKTDGRGGIILNKKTVIIHDGQFLDSEAKGKEGGGAIACTGGTQLTINNGTFQRNKATCVPGSGSESDDTYGGGAIQSSGTVTIANGTFEANESRKGGTIYMVEPGQLKITGGVFGGAEGKGNKATYRGAVVYMHDRESASNVANANIQNAKFSYNTVVNTSGVSGGVMYLGDKTKTAISKCEFTNNKADATSSTSYGGVMYLYNAVLTVSDGMFANNYGDRGGGIYISQSGSNCSLNNCTFQDNACHDYGKDIFYDKGSMTLSGKVKVEIDKRALTIKVTGALQEGSQVQISQISTTSNYVQMQFDDSTVMNQSKPYIIYKHKNNFATSRKLEYDTTKYQAILK